MKQRLLAGTASALLTAAALGLTGCGGQPASSLPDSSSDVSSIASNPASSNPASSSAPPVSDIPSSSTLPTYTPGAITKEQAMAITQDVLKRESHILLLLSAPTIFESINPSFLGLDESQSIPEHSEYWLVTNERFQSLADLRAYAEEIVYTFDYIDNSAVLYYFEDEDFDQYPSYKEYNDRLYASSIHGGKGSIAEEDWNSLRILSQEENSLTVQVDIYADNKLIGTETYSMKESGNIWRLDDRSGIKSL